MVARCYQNRGGATHNMHVTRIPSLPNAALRAGGGRAALCRPRGPNPCARAVGVRTCAQDPDTDHGFSMYRADDSGSGATPRNRLRATVEPPKGLF